MSSDAGKEAEKDKDKDKEKEKAENPSTVALARPDMPSPSARSFLMILWKHISFIFLW